MGFPIHHQKLIMRTKPGSVYARWLVAAFAVAGVPLHAATIIGLDLTTTNPNPIVLAAGSNNFSFANFSVNYLIVGGGGSGGSVNSASRAGGGGGAGGLRTGATSITGLQTITVGAGGVSPLPTGSGAPLGTNGGNSVAFGFTATGGGAGGTNSVINGAAGGSGGGGGNNSGAPGTGGAGTVGQGNAGAASSISPTRFGGGGGGAGGAGSGATGGAGSSSSITGSAVTYAAGGNGLTVVTGTGSNTGASAAANTGNGGGGAKRDVSAGAGNNSGGTGGSGIVVASYAGTTQLLSGGTVTTAGGNTIHTFTSSGSLDLYSATIDGAISGPGNLGWNKAGTLTLGGNNTYTGSTEVSVGTLALTGSIASTSNLTFSGGGILDLGLSGLLRVLQSNYSIGDANTDISANSIIGDNTLAVSTFNDGSNDYTQIAVVPEPTTIAILGAGVALLGLTVARRRKG